MDKEINICFASDANYAKYMGVAISSLLRHKNKDDDIYIYVIDGGISQEDKDKIEDLKKKMPFHIKYIKIDKKFFEKFPLGKTHISLATYYRLIAASLFPKLKRIIYLDCDLIVRSSLSELYNTDFEGNLCLGCIDICYSENCARLNLDRYVNAGVLLIDLDGWRKNDIEQKFMDYIKNNYDKIVFYDQDVINSVLCGEIGYIDMKWNAQVAIGNLCLTEDYRQIGKQSYIMHFISAKKPWKITYFSFEEYWWKEFKKSPWRNFKGQIIHFFNILYRIKHKLFFYGGEKKGKYVTFRFFGIKFRKQRRDYLLENEFAEMRKMNNQILQSLGNIEEKIGM